MKNQPHVSKEETIDLPVAHPSKIYVAGVKFRQYLFREKTSWPYLSSDTFRELADLSYPYLEDKITEAFVQKLVTASIVFCPSHLLDAMLERFGSRMQCAVIICSNSDHEFHKRPASLPPKLKLLLLENSFISDNRLIYTIPIGIENLRVGMNGMKSLFSDFHKMKKRDEVLVGPFSPTHATRSAVVKNFLVEPGPWQVINSRMNPRNYARLAARYRYIACVRGNSVESHRLWESLYRGSTPLVLRDKWSESLGFMDLPIILVESWHPKHIESILFNNSPRPLNPDSYPALWMPYWERFLKEKLQS